MTAATMALQRCGRQFGVVPSACPWKVGFDLGTATVVMQEVSAGSGEPLRPSASAFPAVLAYPGSHRSSEVTIGEAAARRRDCARLLSPFSPPADLNPSD